MTLRTALATRARRAAAKLAPVKKLLSPFDFDGCSAVITGGSRGLGLALARQLGREGAKLALFARDEDELARAAAELEAAGADVMTVACDAGDRGAIERAIAEVTARRGRIDLLVNNAGVIHVGPVEHMTVAEFERAMASHFWGPLYATLAVVPQMKRRGAGRIANISSIAERVALPHLAPYGSSKSALAGLSDALRAELAPYGIAVTTVTPSLLGTGSYRRAARRILRAIRRGQPVSHVAAPARALALANALVPNLAARLITVAAALLPAAPRAPDEDERAARSVPAPLPKSAPKPEAKPSTPGSNGGRSPRFGHFS